MQRKNPRRAFTVWCWTATLLCTGGLVNGVVSQSGIFTFFGVVGILTYGTMAVVETYDMVKK